MHAAGFAPGLSVFSTNTAICSRVTGRSGQYRSSAGGLQPRVMPVVASHVMSLSKRFPGGTSRKPEGGASSLEPYSSAPTSTALPTGREWRSKSSTVHGEVEAASMAALAAAEQQPGDAPLGEAFLADHAGSVVEAIEAIAAWIDEPTPARR